MAQLQREEIYQEQLVLREKKSTNDSLVPMKLLRIFLIHFRHRSQVLLRPQIRHFTLNFDQSCDRMALTEWRDFAADVAQLVRAPGCGSGGRGFNSHHSPHKELNI